MICACGRWMPAGEVGGDLRAEVAEVLAAHRLHASMNICTGCDWRATPEAGSLLDQHEAHRADALAPLLARRAAEARAEALRGVRFRVETACDGYENLMPSDAPEFEGYDHTPTEAYIAGAAEAARQIRAALAARSDQGGA